ncbi:protein L [Stenotrophomonas cyclobalanopsidis]|uniref:Protein L n=1 Tax=Stenotrophomonas cyclobalanopsidis TaxID=2771362 RepID=A0ABQ6T3V4_9GAMM|nr:protein L [Stenotrophomonas cyclobalanopsidis]KAA9003375.1 protein L [Stenotrophomonas cyclobalanopsidis]
MAWHTSTSVLTVVDPSNSWWTAIYEPGAKAPVCGIYRCKGCKCEITRNQGEAFPPPSHHPHLPGQSRICWILNVRTNAPVG